MTKIAFDGTLTCVLSVANLSEAVAWYRDVLEFQPVYCNESTGWCEMTTGIPGVTIGLQQIKDIEGRPGEVPQPGATLTFGVLDIEVARDRLEERGAQLSDDVRVVEGVVKLMTLFDRDRNEIVMCQTLQQVNALTPT
jgi:predicted enzyme related to lactoylglutathione lyase